MKTIIIIVNWNGKHLLSNCLTSLNRQTVNNFGIILVDNGSEDGSVEYVKRTFPKVNIIELSDNIGFAKANNVGISHAIRQDNSVENIVLLNNDTKAKNDFLEKVTSCQSGLSTLKVGALAPKMLLWKESSRSNQPVIDSVGVNIGADGRGKNVGYQEIDEGQYDTSREVGGFCGGAVLLKKRALQDVLLDKRKVLLNLKNGEKFKYQQYFDDTFFAYYEDVDLSLRLRRRGWNIVTVPQAVVWHIHSATADTITTKRFKAYYLNRNRFLVMLKNFSKKELKKGFKLLPKSYVKKGKSFTDGKVCRIKELWTKMMTGMLLMRIFVELIIEMPTILRKRKKIQG